MPQCADGFADGPPTDNGFRQRFFGLLVALGSFPDAFTRFTGRSSQEPSMAVVGDDMGGGGGAATREP